MGLSAQASTGLKLARTITELFPQFVGMLFQLHSFNGALSQLLNFRDLNQIVDDAHWVT